MMLDFDITPDNAGFKSSQSSPLTSDTLRYPKATQSVSPFILCGVPRLVDVVASYHIRPSVESCCATQPLANQEHPPRALVSTVSYSSYESLTACATAYTIKYSLEKTYTVAEDLFKHT